MSIVSSYCVLINGWRRPFFLSPENGRWILSQVSAADREMKRSLTRAALALSASALALCLAGEARLAPLENLPENGLQDEEDGSAKLVEPSMSAFTKRKIWGSAVAWAASGVVLGTSLALGMEGYERAMEGLSLVGAMAAFVTWNTVPLSSRDSEYRYKIAALSFLGNAAIGFLPITTARSGVRAVDILGTWVTIATGLTAAGSLILTQGLIILTDDPVGCRTRSAWLPDVVPWPEMGASLIWSF